VTEDKVEVGAGPVKVAASGASVARIGESIADLISPFSQGFGLVGDHIRIYRQRSVAAVLSKATEIAGEREQRISPVNPKNLFPIIENASLESDDGEEIIDLWARLLLTGTENFDAELAVFSDVLKRIGKSEALFLRGLVEPDRRFPKMIHSDIEEYYNPRQFQGAFEDSLQSITSREEFLKKINDTVGSVQITYGCILSIGTMGNQDTYSYITDALANKNKTISVLEREGLVVTRNVYFTAGQNTFAANICSATNMGVSLIARCYPRLS